MLQWPLLPLTPLLLQQLSGGMLGRIRSRLNRSAAQQKSTEPLLFVLLCFFALFFSPVDLHVPPIHNIATFECQEVYHTDLYPCSPSRHNACLRAFLKMLLATDGQGRKLAHPLTRPTKRTADSICLALSLLLFAPYFKQRIASFGLQTLLILMTVRSAAAAISYITDCDETFNYWEPMHYMIHGFGLQTWE